MRLNNITLTVSAALLLSATNAGAVQTLLPGNLIPKFVDPLPEAGAISVVDATSAGPHYCDPATEATVYDSSGVPVTDSAGATISYYTTSDGTSCTTQNSSSYNIRMREFQANILPENADIPPDPVFLPAGLLRGTPTSVWGYLTDTDLTGSFPRKSYLGPVVVAERGIPAHPTYTNELPVYPAGDVQAILPIDMTLDWANPNGIDCLVDALGNYTNPDCGIFPYTGPLPDSVHIHGGEVAPAYDGGPDAWFTQGNGITGTGFPGNTFTYENGQQEATIWFHPHGFGITRLNVYAGMAGVHAIVDPANPPVTPMPKFPQHDIPLIIQDRSFDTTGQIFYNLASNPQPNPTVHPFWIPEFIGDTILVNGKTWPYLNVEPRQYRFRLLNGSNARFYGLTINYTKVNKNKTTNTVLPMISIATDDGYLANAVSTPNIVIAPGERQEVIVDFSALPVGSNAIMLNSARTPFPGGAKPTIGGTDTVMQFRVVANTSGLPLTPIVNGDPIRQNDPNLPNYNPIQPIANGIVPMSLPQSAPVGNIVRQLTLNEVIGAGGPLELVVNNSKYNMTNNDTANPRLVPVLPDCSSPLCRETEMPAVGDTEVWEIINITADAHPMHTHLTSFQVIDRTPFQASSWLTIYDSQMLLNGVLPGGGPPNVYSVRNTDGAIGGNPAVGPFLQLNKRRLPLPNELGWKDTVITYPGEVTRIAVRWAPQDAPVVGAVAADGNPIPTCTVPTPTGTDPTSCVPTEGANLYPFDPTALINGVGYVWHCHILDHEDNEMMRTYTVMPDRQQIQ